MNRFGFKSLWHHLPKRRKRQFWLLLLLMILASFLEIVSIGSILPFLGMLTSPEQIYQHQLMMPIVELLDIENSSQLILPITIFFISAVIIAAIVRIVLLFVMTRFSYATGADLSINIYNRTLYQDYSTHITRNSSEVINGVITKTNTVTGNIIMAGISFLSAATLILSILLFLLSIDVVVTLSLIVVFGILYSSIIRYTRKQLKENSSIIAEKSTKMIQSLQEGLGGIRDVIVDNSQQFYCDLYRSSDLPLRKAAGNNLFIAGAPRFVLEAFGITLIAMLGFILSQQEGGISIAIPVLGSLALGAQRLLPAFQMAYASYSKITGAEQSFKDVLNLMDQPLPEFAHLRPPTSIPFKDRIELADLNFRYTKDTSLVLKDINLTISKGERIGIIGSTGSGKSTLIDIIMGLLIPTNGGIEIDQAILSNENIRSWQRRITHVPQNIYLSDATIEENIAFGIHKNEIDSNRVKLAAKQAQISMVIEELEDSYQAKVGENGVLLSGGQRQRIGIARALYKKADVIIFDEATSALDGLTEKLVMESINKLDGNITILMIAHRISSLNGCDRIIKLDKGEIVDNVKYN